MTDLLNFFADNVSLLVDRTIEHIVICAIAMAVSIAIALPAGVLLGHRHTGSFLAINGFPWHSLHGNCPTSARVETTNGGTSAR